MSSARLSNQKV